jgi:hypothetical protein
MNTLIFIDSYISDINKAALCSNLIKQVREYFPEYKILLINKAQNNYNLDSLVDYYFSYQSNILIGKPPQELLDKELYDRPYIYLDISLGTCENWLPLTGVTDHVASMFNGYVLSSQIAKTLGYQKVFKIDYDVILDKEESKEIKLDIENFKDYLFYGKRQEGQWAKPSQYLIDNHLLGYSPEIFLDQNLLNDSSDFWALCDKISYYGKWIEYVIPLFIEYKKQFSNLEGIIYENYVGLKFPKIKFDQSSSESDWNKIWNCIPKVCRISYDNGQTEVEDALVLFFWNSISDSVDVECTVTNINNEIIFKKDLNLLKSHWFLDKITFTEDLFIDIVNKFDGKVEQYSFGVNSQNRELLLTRFLFN